MTRFHCILVALAILTTVWLSACLGVQSHVVAVFRYAVFAAPLLLLAFLGFYAFILLVLGVMNFRTVPGEAESLRTDIAEAREYFRVARIHLQ